MKKENVQKIADLLYKEIGYMYCDNCRFNSEIKEEDTDEWGCDECHRKYNGWGISRAESERIATEISSIIRSHMDDVKNDGWIPVSERLPEESDYYMACIYNDEVDDYDFRKTWFAHADDYDMDESEWRELYDFERVIAWQPLPEPYKEE